MAEKTGLAVKRADTGTDKEKARVPARNPAAGTAAATNQPQVTPRAQTVPVARSQLVAPVSSKDAMPKRAQARKTGKNRQLDTVEEDEEDEEEEALPTVGPTPSLKQHQKQTRERGDAVCQNTTSNTLAPPPSRLRAQASKALAPSAPEAATPEMNACTSRRASLCKKAVAPTDNKKAPAPPCKQAAGAVKKRKRSQAPGTDCEAGDSGDDNEVGEDAAAPEPAACARGRPKRTGMERLVYVNGQPVLKNNLYGLDAGEPSVYDRELAKGRGKDLYKGMAGVTLAPPPPQAKRSKPAVPKIIAPLTSARNSHNHSMRSAAAASAVIRFRYLSQHVEALRPFVPDSVLATICKEAANVPAGWVEPEPFTQQPACITGEMKGYQLEGVAWITSKFHNGVNVVLADEMGLGKTLQTIAFLASLTIERYVSGPHLIVVPLSVLPSWMKEFQKWCPSLRVVQLHCTDDAERERLCREELSDPRSFDVVVTTYDMIDSSHFSFLLQRSIVWKCLVLDEGHKIKNEFSQVSSAARRIKCQHKLMLTGTPVQNNLHESFAMLNFMYPDIFIDSSPFDRAFNLRARKADPVTLQAAHYLLRPFILRRIKTEVDIQLPPKLETTVHCHLSGMQTFFYREMLLHAGEEFAKLEAAVQAQDNVNIKVNRGAMKHALNLVTNLRMLCIHPFIFAGAEAGFDGETTTEDIVEASGKMAVLDRMLPKLKSEGHRVVLFSQFNGSLDCLEDYLVMRGYTFRRLDGSTNRVQRMIDMEQFNKPNSNIFIYILNTRAGGLGVNLQTADTCILMDSDYNPQCDEQAMARVHRMGQPNPVLVLRLICDGTVEEQVQNIAASKLYLDQVVNRGSTATAQGLDGMSQQDLLSTLKFGADRIFKNDSGKILSDADLDMILDRSQMVAESLPPTASAPAVTFGKAFTAKGSNQAARSIPAPSSAAGAPLPAAATTTTMCIASTSTAGPDVASTSAAGAVGTAMLVYSKHNALSFDAQKAPGSTFMFGGLDYAKKRVRTGSNGDDVLNQIGEQYHAERRKSKAVLVQVDGHPVLKKNHYSMEEGGISIGIKDTQVRRKYQVAGTDYTHMDQCLVCLDGGDLMCCDQCPAAYHVECLKLESIEFRKNGSWVCPHHICYKCAKPCSEVGGMLFRCILCPIAFCENHRPDGNEFVGKNNMYEALGQIHPRTASFVTCSAKCRRKQLEMADFWETTVDNLTSEYDSRIKEARVTKQEEASEKLAASKKGAAAARVAKASKLKGSVPRPRSGGSAPTAGVGAAKLRKQGDPKLGGAAEAPSAQRSDNQLGSADPGPNPGPSDGLPGAQPKERVAKAGGDGRAIKCQNSGKVPIAKAPVVAASKAARTANRKEDAVPLGPSGGPEVGKGSKVQR